MFGGTSLAVPGGTFRCREGKVAVARFPSLGVPEPASLDKRIESTSFSFFKINKFKHPFFHRCPRSFSSPCVPGGLPDPASKRWLRGKGKGKGDQACQPRCDYNNPIPSGRNTTLKWERHLSTPRMRDSQQSPVPASRRTRSHGTDTRARRLWEGIRYAYCKRTRDAFVRCSKPSF